MKAQILFKYYYIDLDLVGDVDNKINTTIYMCILKNVGMNYVSKLQNIVALSTSYYKANNEIVWLQSFLEE